MLTGRIRQERYDGRHCFPCIIGTTYTQFMVVGLGSSLQLFNFSCTSTIFKQIIHNNIMNQRKTTQKRIFDSIQRFSSDGFLFMNSLFFMNDTKEYRRVNDLFNRTFSRLCDRLNHIGQGVGKNKELITFGQSILHLR